MATIKFHNPRLNEYITYACNHLSNLRDDNCIKYLRVRKKQPFKLSRCNLEKKQKLQIMAQILPWVEQIKVKYHIHYEGEKNGYGNAIYKCSFTACNGFIWGQIYNTQEQWYKTITTINWFELDIHSYWYLPEIRHCNYAENPNVQIVPSYFSSSICSNFQHIWSTLLLLFSVTLSNDFSSLSIAILCAHNFLKRSMISQNHLDGKLSKKHQRSVIQRLPEILCI